MSPTGSSTQTATGGVVVDTTVSSPVLATVTAPGSRQLIFRGTKTSSGRPVRVSEVVVAATDSRVAVKYDADGRPTSLATDNDGSAIVDWSTGSPVFTFVASDGTSVAGAAHPAGSARVSQATVQADSGDCDGFADALLVICAGGEQTVPAFQVACGGAALTKSTLLRLCELGATALKVICAGVVAQAGKRPDGVAGTLCNFVFDEPDLGRVLIGTIRDSVTNAPIQGASVSVGDATAVTDANGAYVALPNLGGGGSISLRVTIAASGYLTDPSPLASWAEGVLYVTLDRSLTRAAASVYRGQFVLEGEYLFNNSSPDSCVYKFTQEFTDVTLTPLKLSSGAVYAVVFSAKYRSTTGPALRGRPECSLFVTQVTPVTVYPSTTIAAEATSDGGFKFALHNTLNGTDIEGTGSASSAAGTYSLFFPSTAPGPINGYPTGKGTFVLAPE